MTIFIPPIAFPHFVGLNLIFEEVEQDLDLLLCSHRNYHWIMAKRPRLTIAFNPLHKYQQLLLNPIIQFLPIHLFLNTPMSQ